MACSPSQSLISANSYAFTTQNIIRRPPLRLKGNSTPRLLTVAAAAAEDPDCNTEECAPDKEVGKVSMEWLAGEKTRVLGTYPPKKKAWSGYVEKDTAGQTNIYSVEPSVYVAESAISSGSAGTSSDGAENTAAIAAGLALISIAAASSILLQVSKNTPQVQSSEYSGPPLSYYISKFKPESTVEASAPPETLAPVTADASVPLESQDSTTLEASVPPEPQAPSDIQPETSADVVLEAPVASTEQSVIPAPSVLQ